MGIAQQLCMPTGRLVVYRSRVALSRPAQRPSPLGRCPMHCAVHRRLWQNRCHVNRSGGSFLVSNYIMLARAVTPLLPYYPLLSVFVCIQATVLISSNTTRACSAGTAWGGPIPGTVTLTANDAGLASNYSSLHVSWIPFTAPSCGGTGSCQAVATNLRFLPGEQYMSRSSPE
ncbi:hypothetical protein BDZ88DRAFT_266978 [Geranomyces variabilis]|nr:hypothetical protein BDZ88DRAFT_266978 [Geranomyces variabilis]